MAKYGPAAVPPDDEFVAAVERYYPYPETILGGVPSRVIADELDLHRDTVTQHCQRLVDDGQLRQLDARNGYTFAPSDDSNN